MIIYFTYESRDTLKLFSLVSQCQNYHETESGTRRNILDKNKKLAVVVHVLLTTQHLIISRCCFAEDGKEMYQEL